MDASEARKLSEEYNYEEISSQLKSIMTSVIKIAKSGGTDISYFGNINDKVQKLLIEKGYTIKDLGYHRNERTYTISW